MRPVAALLIGTLVLAGCGQGRSNPFASFDAKCAELPATRFNITTVPLTYVENTSQTIDQLTVLGGNTPDKYTTFGLTTVRFGHETDIEVRVFEDGANARACGTATVDVKLSMQPVVVYVGKELVRTPCAHEATRAHELKHIASFRQVLAEAANDLKSDLGDAIGTGVRRAGNRQEIERSLSAQIKAYLSTFVTQWQREMTARQDAVDSEEERANVAGACRR
jgi:hypothetical protein